MLCVCVVCCVVCCVLCCVLPASNVMPRPASRSRQRRRAAYNIEQRCARVEILVHVGELSAELAPGNQHTLDVLRDQSRRPPLPREPLPEELNLFVFGASMALVTPMKHLFAFMDDTYLITKPARVARVYRFLERTLWRYSGI